MAVIQFPQSTAPGIKPTESGGRIINAYSEPAPEGSRGPWLHRRSPGLRPAFNLSDDTARGAVLVDNQLYVGNGETVDLITKSGDDYTVTPQTGTLSGVGPVFMARNMNATPQILIVHSAGMAQVSGGAVASFSDPDLPSVNAISYQDSYFFPTTENGYAYASGVNDVTFASVDKTRAEGSPDGLLRAIPSGRDQLLMGTATIEVWSNTGNATGYPFSRSTVIKVGLWGRYAVAGWEEGYTGGVAFVASDNTVRLMNGYSPVVISKPWIEALIKAVTDRDGIEASVYVDKGRPVFVISSDEWTLEYSVSTGNWGERKSLGQSRWRAHGGINAFNEWLVFDTETTDVYRIDADYARENTDQLIYEMRSTQAHGFPSRAEILRASFDMRTGVGVDTGIDPIETNPQVQISWSDDGGVTFGNPILRSLGTQGEIRGIDLRNCGTTKRFGRQWKLVVADPVDVALYGGAMDVQGRASDGGH